MTKNGCNASKSGLKRNPRGGLNPLFWVFLLCIAFWALVIMLLCRTARAEDIDIERIANAIKRAENSYNHPYGILKAYCKPGDPNGQCRKGCIQTIEKRLRLWNGEGDFIEYLSKSYAPIGAKNDPNGLNNNWVSNVRYFYERTGT